MHQQLLKAMFSEMVVKKDATLIGKYYHPDFILESNGKSQNFEEFFKGHERVYATAITYDLRYDESSWIESKDKVAVRLWITTHRAGEIPVEIQVVLIATYVGSQISHLLELTWPDWTQVQALESY